MRIFSFFSFIKILYYFFSEIISNTPVSSTKIFTGIYLNITIYSFTFLVSHYFNVKVFEIINQILIIFMIIVGLIATSIASYYMKKINPNTIKINTTDKFNFIFYVLVMLCCTVYASSFLELPQH